MFPHQSTAEAFNIFGPVNIMTIRKIDRVEVAMATVPGQPCLGCWDLVQCSFQPRALQQPTHECLARTSAGT